MDSKIQLQSESSFHPWNLHSVSVLKSVNLQYNTLGHWFAGTNDSSTKRLMFQVLFFFIISSKIHCKNCFNLFSYFFRAATAAKDTKDWSLPSFGSHLNPISTRGGRLCPPYTAVLGWLKFAVAALFFMIVTTLL